MKPSTLGAIGLRLGELGRGKMTSPGAQ